MLRKTRNLLCAIVALLVVAACNKGGGGGGGGGDASVDQATVRDRLCQLLVLGVRDDVKSAAPLLALQEYENAIATGARPRAVKDLPAADRDEIARACFSQLQAFASATALDDSAAIQAAVTAGSVKWLPKLSLAEFEFAAPRADGRGKPLRYRAKFARHPDGEWRMSELQELFN